MDHFAVSREITNATVGISVIEQFTPSNHNILELRILRKIPAPTRPQKTKLPFHMLKHPRIQQKFHRTLQTEWNRISKVEYDDVEV